MKAAGVSEIKQELADLPPKKLLELCLHLVRYKKENKELMSFLLFDSHNLEDFIARVKEEIDEQFTELPKPNRYHTKKGLRKILRAISKYTKFTGSGEPAIEMLLYFCTKLKSSSIPLHKDQVILNIYNLQLKKIETMLESIHEDLRYDYQKRIDELKNIDGEEKKPGLLKRIFKS
jgi:hypothetical protein